MKKIYSVIFMTFLLTLIAGCCCSLCSKINIPTQPTPNITGNTGITGNIGSTENTGTTEVTGSTENTDTSLLIDGFSYMEGEDGADTTNSTYKPGEVLWYKFHVKGVVKALTRYSN